MSKKFGVKTLLFTVLVSIAMILAVTLNAYADSSTSIISGRLAAIYDSKSGTVTAMVAGYCEGQPVTIGPSTWSVAEREFANMKAEDIAKTLCGENHTLQRVTKSTNNGKEIVADVIIAKNKSAGLVGR